MIGPGTSSTPQGIQEVILMELLLTVSIETHAYFSRSLMAFTHKKVLGTNKKSKEDKVFGGIGRISKYSENVRSSLSDLFLLKSDDLSVRVEIDGPKVKSVSKRLKRSDNPQKASKKPITLEDTSLVHNYIHTRSYASNVSIKPYPGLWDEEKRKAMEIISNDIWILYDGMYAKTRQLIKERSSATKSQQTPQAPQ